MIKSARLRMLRSGHSHEDVDQCFGRLASYMSRHAKTATGPHQFRDIIQEWMDSKLDRPYETERHAVLLDQCRDWLLGQVVRSLGHRNWQVVRSRLESCPSHSGWQEVVASCAGLSGEATSLLGSPFSSRESAVLEHRMCSNWTDEKT